MTEPYHYCDAYFSSVKEVMFSSLLISLFFHLSVR